MIVAVVKGIDKAHGMSTEKELVRLPMTWAMLAEVREGGREYGRRGVRHVVGTARVILYFVPSVGSVGVRQWAGTSRVIMSDAEMHFYEGGQVAFENRSKCQASKCDETRAGCTITRTRLVQEKEAGGGSMRGSEAVLQLLDVYPVLPVNAPLAGRSTPLGWKVFTRTEAVAALRCMVGSIGRDPVQFALHSGRMVGGTQLASSRISELSTERAGHWKPRAFITYAKEAGEGASCVSAAPAKIWTNTRESMKKTFYMVRLLHGVRGG